MKTFSNDEKNLIRGFYTAKNNGGFLYNHLWDKLDKEILIIDKAAGSVKLYYPNEDRDPTQQTINDAISKMAEIEKEILVISNLLNYLEKNGYIQTILSTENAAPVETIQKGFPSRVPITREFPDEAVNRLLIGYLDKRVVTSPDLDELVQKAFVSKEDRQFKTTIRATWIGIVTAIVIGIASLVMGIVTLVRPTSMSDADRAVLQTLDDRITQGISDAPINKQAIHLQEIHDFLRNPIHVVIDRNTTGINTKP